MKEQIFLPIDKEYIVKITNTGLTFSVMNAYFECGDIAVKYINRINIPSIKFDLEDYFNLCLKSNDINLLSSGFFLQVQIPQEEVEIAIVHQIVTEPVQTDYISILLDLDISDLSSFHKLWMYAIFKISI